MKKASIAIILLLAIVLVAGIACGDNGNIEPTPTLTPTPSPSPTPTPMPTPNPIITNHWTTTEEWQTSQGNYILEVWYSLLNEGSEGYVEIIAEVWVGQDYFSERSVIHLYAGEIKTWNSLRFPSILEEEDTPFTYRVSAAPTTQ